MSLLTRFLLLSLACVGLAYAQTYPSRPARIMVTHPSMSVKSFRDMVALAKARPIFGTGCSRPRKPIAESLIDARIFPGERVMLSVVRVEPNSRGTIHSHPEEQWGVLLEGQCTRIQNGEEVEAVAGNFWYTPGGASHGVRTDAMSAVILDIFSPPRAEYRQAGEGFGTAATERRENS
jgi:quercetin dioxygenase-like cupin family protein